MNHQLYERPHITFTLGTRIFLAPTSFAPELLYFFLYRHLFVLRLESGYFDMSKGWSAIKDKIEFVNFQVKLMLLLINIMGFWGGYPELLQNI